MARYTGPVCRLCRREGVKLYLNGVTQYEYKSNLLHGFFSYRDAAKRISKERAEMFKYSAITYAAREGWESYYLLHTELAQKMSDNLKNYAANINAGVSFEDDGNDLSADHYKKNMYSRESVLKLQEARFKAINDSGQKMMVKAGNDYAVPYSSMVTDMDLRGNDYTILDECIPFYQLAIHGYIEYTGDPLNISGNDVQLQLHAALIGELGGVKVSDGGFCPEIFHAGPQPLQTGDSLEDDRGDARRGFHSLEPAVATICVPAGGDLAQQFLVGHLCADLRPEALSHLPHV